MSQMFAGELIALAVSAVFALWDIKFRRAPHWLFAAGFLAGCIFAAAAERTLTSVLLALIPGLLLLLLSVLTEGGVGAGDGLFYASLAGFLDPRDSFLILLASVFLAGLAALFLYAIKRDRKASIPFLAMVPASLLILLAGGM